MKRLILFLLLITFCMAGCSANDEVASSFFADKYVEESTEIKIDISVPEITLDVPDKFLYEDICFSEEDVIIDGAYDFTAAAVICFNISDAEIIYSKGMFDKIYPASTTKLLTAITALKYGELDSVITISEDNCGITTPGAQLCGFKKGDRITLRELMHCLLVYSGNDSSVAIAEAISGSTEEFMKLMNKTAKELGAKDTNMTNPHGLHELNHYTTAYDMYLILNECLKYDILKEIFAEKEYTAIFEDADGNQKTLPMLATNLYYSNNVEAPEGIEVLGGKTGETIAAGKCLIIRSMNSDGKMFITGVFKTEDKPTLYNEMNELLKLCK